MPKTAAQSVVAMASLREMCRMVMLLYWFPLYPEPLATLARMTGNRAR
jgi:hypothetical protein